MKSVVIVLHLVFFMFGTAHCQLRGVYLVGKQQAFPFGTISSAANELNQKGISGSVTFLLTDEVYEESEVEFKNIPGTSSTSTITIRPADATHVEIRGAGGYVLGFRSSYFCLVGKSPAGTGSLTIRSLERKQNSSVIRTIVPRDVNITDCNIIAAPTRIHENQTHKSYGIQFSSDNSYYSLSNVIIANNSFSGGSLSISIISNYFFDKIQVAGNNFTRAGGVRLLFSEPTAVKRIEVQDNIFKNSNLGIFHGFLGVVSVRGAEELEFTNNKFDGLKFGFDHFNLSCTLIRVEGVKNASVANNVVKNINFNASVSPFPGIEIGTVFELFAFSVNGTLKFCHNSVYIPHNKDLGFYVADSYLSAISLIDNKLFDCRNNIFVLLQGNKLKAANSWAVMYNFESYQDIISLKSNHNTYYVDNHTANDFYYLSDNSVQSLSFGQWREKYPLQDRDSYWELPKVRSENDLHLASDCGRGVYIVDFPYDYDGQKRSVSTPDIGAYEFKGNSPSLEYKGSCQLSPISFSVTSTSDIHSFLWHLGDGHTSTHASPTHTYQQAGTYTVRLDLTKTDGSTETLTREITIYPKPSTSPIYHKP